MANPRRFIFPSILLIAILILSVSFALNNANPSKSYPIEDQQSSAPQSEEFFVISRAFPPEILHWEEYIAKASGASGLDPNLIAAIILQESGGQENVISHSGAVGLMQVMPRDGIASGFFCVNGPCFQNRPTTEELLDPSFNIEYGARLLAGLLNSYPEMRDALKAYGPMDVGHRYADIVLSIYRSKS